MAEHVWSNMTSIKHVYDQLYAYNAGIPQNGILYLGPRTNSTAGVSSEDKSTLDAIGTTYIVAVEKRPGSKPSEVCRETKT